MTTEKPVEDRDELDEDSQALDTEQGGGDVSQPPDWEAPINSLKTEVRGIQGLTDKGLNAIAERMERRIDEGFAARERFAQEQDLLESMPEEQRSAYQALLKSNAELRSQIAQISPEPGAPSDEMEAVYEIVEDYGLKRDTPGIDYDAFSDASLTQRQMRQRFFASLDKAKANNGALSTETLIDPSRRGSREPGPGPTPPPRGGVQSQDDILNEYLTDRATKEETVTKLRAAGHSQMADHL